MRMRRRRFRPWMLLAVVLALLLVAFFGTFFAKDGAEPAAGGLAGSAAAPAVSGASGLGYSIRDFFERLFGLRDVDKEYEELKTRVQMLETENQMLLDVQAENDRLNELLGFKDEFPQFVCLPARVIGKELGSLFIIFTLNRGSDQGVEKDMTVVNELGLVGRVVEVGSSTCKVMAVIDRQSAVSAVIARTGDNGIVHGSGDPQGREISCDILHLPITSEIEPGDKVVTSEVVVSDIGGVFPNGILIGTITEVSRNQKYERLAKLAPAVDFAHVRNVLIITKVNDDAQDTGNTAQEPQQSAPPEPEGGN